MGVVSAVKFIRRDNRIMERKGREVIIRLGLVVFSA